MPFVVLLSILLCHLARCSGTVMENDGYVEPYFLIAVNNMIDRLNMDGEDSHTVCQESINIEAIDYHYRMQYVYMILISGEIRRVRLNDTRNQIQVSESVVFPAHTPKDLAVDWIENILYWTIGRSDTNVYILNLALIGETTTAPVVQEIEVALENPVFTDIALNPLNRTMYVSDVESEVIREIGYDGVQSGKVFHGMYCPALSYVHNCILWYQDLTEIHVQGLTDESFTRIYTVDGYFLREIAYFQDRIYWSQKEPMGIFYSEWNKSKSVEVFLIKSFPSTGVINDMALVHPSKQPYTANDILAGAYKDNEMLSVATRISSSTTYNGPSTVLTTTEQYQPTPSTTLAQPETPDSIQSLPSQSPASTPETSNMVASTTTEARAYSVTEIITSTLKVTSRLVKYTTRSHQPTAFVSLPTSHTPQTAVSIVSSSFLSHHLSDSNSTSPSIHTTPSPSPSSLTLINPTPRLSLSTAASTISSLFQSRHVSDSVGNSYTPSPTSVHTTLPPSPSSINPTPSTVHEMGQFMTSVSNNNPVPVLRLFSSGRPFTVISGQEGSVDIQNTETVSTLHSQPPASATVVGVAPSTSSSGTTETTVSSSGATIEPSSVGDGNDSGILPSLAAVLPNTSSREGTLEAIAITAACLGVAILIFVGLAISDAIYYFSYERRAGKQAPTGLLGGLWKLVTLPCHWMAGPRYMLRKRRRFQHPYIPRCMNESDISTYTADSSQTATTSLSTDHSGTTTVSTDQSPDQNGMTTVSTDHNGTPTTTAADLDLSFLSADSGNSQVDITSQEDNITASDARYDDNNRDTPSEDLTQLEMETKVALDELEVDSGFDKKDLSLQ